MPTQQDEPKAQRQKLYDRMKFHTTQSLLRDIIYQRNQIRSKVHSLREEVMEMDVLIEILYKRLYKSEPEKRGRKKKMVTDPTTGHRIL